MTERKLMFAVIVMIILFVFTAGALVDNYFLNKKRGSNNYQRGQCLHAVEIVQEIQYDAYKNDCIAERAKEDCVPTIKDIVEWGEINMKVIDECFRKYPIPVGK